MRTPARTPLCVVALVAAGALACGDSRRDPSPGAAVESRGAGESTAEAPDTPDPHLISESGVGAVRLGMSLDEAREALPAARFERTSDGEGVALVEAVLGTGEAMVLFAGEDDPAAPIDGSKRIVMIETFSPAFRTAEGVRPGSLVTDAESAYGSVEKVVRSEIESREYVRFARQPAGLRFRLDYTGVFPPGASETTALEPGGRIHSIEVWSSETR